MHKKFRAQLQKQIPVHKILKKLELTIAETGLYLGLDIVFAAEFSPDGKI